jgi:hypothetical protein
MIIIRPSFGFRVRPLSFHSHLSFQSLSPKTHLILPGSHNPFSTITLHLPILTHPSPSYPRMSNTSFRYFDDSSHLFSLIFSLLHYNVPFSLLHYYLPFSSLLAPFLDQNTTSSLQTCPSPFLHLKLTFPRPYTTAYHFHCHLSSHSLLSNSPLAELAQDVKHFLRWLFQRLFTQPHHGLGGATECDRTDRPRQCYTMHMHTTQARSAHAHAHHT